ncbi:MAG: SDR family oxidoreductase [Marinoscillum sp.]
MNLKGNVVVVTGAASGIGRELAICLAEEGCHLALSDINFSELEETARLIQNNEIELKLNQLNVADQTAFFAYADEVVAHFGKVDRVINNAGSSVADSFLNCSIDDFRMIMDINFWGVFYGAKAFLPHLLKRPDATLVNVASVNALIPFPNQSSYNVSKSAITGLSESLQQELYDTTVRTMLVFPGGVKTNIVRNGKFVKGPKEAMSQQESADYFEKLAMTSASKAARCIVRGIRRKKKRLRIGLDAYFMDYLKRLLPRFAVWFARWLAKR